MIAQAEHIPVHLGAMPDAVAAVARARPGPGRGLHPQRPVHGRDAPARHHARLAHARSASPSRARTTPTSAAASPGACRPARARLDEEGVVIPPTRLDDDGARRRSSRSMRNPDERRGDLRAQLAAHRLAERRLDELCDRRGARPGRGGDGRALRLLGAPSCARRSRGSRTGATRRPTCSRRDDGELDAPRGGDGRRRRDRDRLRRHRAAARGQPQLPARGHALGLLLRRPLPHRARTCPPRAARSRRCASARRTGCLVNAGRRPRSPPGTSRPRAGSSTSSSPRSARRVAVPAQGQGTMNNVDARERPLHVLRDDRRRAGRVPRRGRALGRARRDVEHAVDTPVEALELAYPAARRAVRAAARLRGRGPRTAAATASCASCARSSRAGCRCSASAGCTAPQRRARRGGRSAWAATS